jgi:Flp pilus assembly protein TadD
LYGRALLLDGETDVAERTLQQATASYPVEPGAFPELAQAAEKLGHVEIARQALIDYLDIVGDSVDVPAVAGRIGVLSLRLDDVEAAVDWLQRAAAGPHADAKLFAALADAQLRAGDRAGARLSLQKGLEKDPTSPALAALQRRR